MLARAETKRPRFLGRVCCVTTAMDQMMQAITISADVLAVGATPTTKANLQAPSTSPITVDPAQEYCPPSSPSTSHLHILPFPSHSLACCGLCACCTPCSEPELDPRAAEGSREHPAAAQTGRRPGDDIQTHLRYAGPIHTPPCPALQPCVINVSPPMYAARLCSPLQLGGA